MDLIFTNANLVDQGILSAYALDLSFGSSEANQVQLSPGFFVEQISQRGHGTANVVH